MTSRHDLAAWIIAAALLFLTLYLRLVPALLAGLLVYELVHVIAARMPLRHAGRDKAAAVGLLTVVIVSLLGLALLAVVALLQSEHGSFARLLQKMAEIIDGSRGKLPGWLVAALPGDTDSLENMITQGLREHAAELRVYGGEVGHAVLHILIGMVIGAIASLGEALPAERHGPLARAMAERARRLGDAFRRVVFAQIRISALNTTFTGVYLLIVLPAFGVHLPLAKTLVAVTFITGLIPVLGNLVSNTIIVVVSLSVSIEVALASLAFLIAIHKLEYFLNARIIGARIHAKMWELLVAMLVMEAAFGLAGLVAAPIFYAFLKDELSAKGLV
ncbi:MAG: AI-2E family transporter [Usitatibacter sp.]